ncbi:MAG: MBL fold metallo-hydrolase [Thermodesulfobacteriota bacterium]
MKIAEDLYFHPWENYSQNNCNSIMIDGAVKTLIDPGHKHLFSQLASRMRADGTAPEDVALVIYTHCHPDHMEAGPELAGQGAKQAMHPDDETYLRQIGPEFYRAMGLTMPAVKIDLNLVEGDLNLGDKNLMIYHTPGHSPGSICLYWPKNKVLIAGDLIFAQGVGRTDFPGGNGRQLKESIRRMAALDVDTILPGHGPAIIGRDKVLRNFQIIEKMYFHLL